MDKKEFVFLSADVISGTSQKTGNPYELNIIHFADPLTFENHSLNFKKGLNLSWLKKGERVFLNYDLVAGYGNRQSSVMVIDVLPA